MPNGKIARLEEKVAEKMFKSLSYIKQSMGMGDIITLGWFPLKKQTFQFPSVHKLP